MKRNNLLKLAVFILYVCLSLRGHAQSYIFGSGYFQNQYLFNPAMTGIKDKEFSLNLGYLSSNNSVVDAPRSLYATADDAFDNSVSGGLSVFNYKAGLLNYSRLAGTYSYHIKLGGENQQISFGISAIGTLERLDETGITGNPDDPSLYNFNNQKMQFESDFGMAYIDDDLTAQAALSNLVALFGNKARDELSKATLFAAVAYKFQLTDDNITIEPKVAFRGYKGIQSVADGGANLVFLKDVLSVYGMYHSNQCATFGMAIKMVKTIQLSVAYTTDAPALQNYSLGNDFEIGLHVFLSNTNN